MTNTKTPTAKPAKGEVSREAKRLAAVILDVLAGSRTPTQAAEGLEQSLPRYYQLEARGLGGLQEPCEPRPRGRQADAGTEEETPSRPVDHIPRA